MEEMEEVVARWKARIPAGSNSLAVVHQNAWDKLRKCYDLTDCAHGIYGAAVLLHPAYRKHVLDHHWAGDEAQWEGAMIGNIKKLARRVQVADTSSDDITAYCPYSSISVTNAG